MCTKYIVVDDDRTNNMICRLMIRNFDEDADIYLFAEPEKGLEWINNNEKIQCDEQAIIFLDINMPTMSGWDFLEEFVKLKTEIKNRYCIYILSSSIEDFSDKAKIYPFVSGFLSKPLTINYLTEINEEQSRVVPLIAKVG